MINQVKTLVLSFACCVCLNSNTFAVPVDIAFIVDQSGSMSGEFSWIPNVIGDIDTALQSESAITSTRYGIVGYMENPKTRANGTALAYQDLTPNVATIQNEANTAASNLFCCRESGFEAAYWSQTGFDWAAEAVKIMILLTDEAADQSSDIGTVPNGVTREQHLGNTLDDAGFLLNVITRTNLYSQWDEAVFDINDPNYTGLFDIGALRNDAAGFTQNFVNAKVQEIVGEIDPTPVPEPGTIVLLSIGLAGIWYSRRRASF